MNDKKKKELARIIAGRMSPKAPQDIDKVRSTMGQIKGALTKDTLYRLRQIVADHQNAGEDEDPNIRIYRLTIIMGLCGDYLNRHGKETDARAREKVDAVEKIQAEAMVERARRQAEAQYLIDAYAKKSEDSPDYAPTRLAEKSAPAAIAVTQAMKLGKGEAGKMEGFNQATLDMMKKYGLTEAEILAVKVYTASDYKYINPATANNESWMKDQITPPKKTSPKAGSSKGSSAASEEDRDLSNLLEPELEDRDLTTLLDSTTEDRELAQALGIADEDERELGAMLEVTEEDERDLTKMLGRAPEGYFDTEEGKKHLKRLFEEGSLHGAMAIAALQKLPPMEKLCYRGARMTEADFTDRYGTRENPKLPSWTLPSLTSVATTREAAQKFADGNTKNRGDAVVSVLTCVHVKTGRDIGDLSIFGRKEKEWLLLPGTVLETDSVEELPKGNVGEPPAKRWAVVMAHEA